MGDYRPHVVIVTEYFPPRRGGLSEVAAHSRQMLERLGYRVSVLWVADDAEGSPGVYPLVEAAQGRGPLISRLSRSLAVWRRLRTMDAEDPIDAVEAPNWNAIGAVTANLAGWPVITRVTTSVLQTEQPPHCWRDRAVRAIIAAGERRALRGSDVVMFSGAAHEQLHREALGLDRRPLDNVQIVPLTTPDPGPATPDPGRPVVLVVARPSWRKGVDLLDAVLLKVADSAAICDVHLVGLNPSDLPGQVGGWNRPTLTLHFHNDVSPLDLAELYRSARVVAMPSRYESFGLVTLEAMAHGRPVVAFDHSGAKDLVIDGVTGYLAKPFDVRAYATKLGRALTDPVGSARIGASARQRYVERFHPDLYERRVASLYAGLAGIGHTRPNRC